jgi:uncharacterized protein (TIGR03000 family)
VGWFSSSNQVQEVKQVYSVVLMMALTTGGDNVALGHHSSCCGQASSCGREHHSRGHHGCSTCGESSGCSTCGYSAGCSTCGQSSGCSTCGHAAGCSTCGHAYAPGCSTCANGVCAVNLADTGAALIVVSLPADAKLTIDGEATTSTSDQRVFVSPSLPTGQEFHYTLKAEIVVNGKTQVVSEVVAVRSGEETRVTLSAPTAVAAR